MIGWLAAATIVEKLYGSAVASTVVYHSWPFVGLWAVIAVIGLWLCVKRKLYLKPAAFAIHLALLVILLGAAATWLFSTEGKIYLVEGSAVSTYEKSDGTKGELPFTVGLEKFEMQFYAGTQTPSAFLASVVFNDGQAAGTHCEVSLNHIASFGGYRFCLSGFGEDGQGAVLKVTHDPIGYAVTHLGYIMLLLGFIGYMLSRATRYRAVLRSLSSRYAAILAMCLLLPQGVMATPRTLPKDVADDFGKLYILHNERICPFETMAREVTLKLYGRTSYKGLDACQVATGWLFYYDDWADEPMIKVQSGQVRQLLGADSKYVSLNAFYDDTHSYRLSQAMQHPSNDVLEANEKCQVAIAMASGTLLRVMPLRRDNTLQWYVPGSLDIPTDIDEGQWAFMRNGMNLFDEFVVKKDWESAHVFIDKLHRYQEREGGGQLPSATRFKAELLYNAIETTLPSAIILILAGMLAVTLVARKGRKALHALVVAAIVVVFVYLTALMALRWIVSGHVPMSNGYETMQLMAWMTLLVTLLVFRRMRLFVPLGALAAGFTLMVASFSGSNPAITPLMPVLNSPWLCLHVVVVMLAYALLAIMALNSIMALIYRRNAELAKTLFLLGQALLYPAVFLLAIGIFIGAVWAGVSWGSYWSWDPKETWALITLLIYAMPIHAASLKHFQKPAFFHAFVILAFLSVIFTYWGVNNLLGGMHSYA